MTLLNRQWLLASQSSGQVQLSNFRLHSESVAEPEMKPGQILVSNLAFHLRQIAAYNRDAPASGHQDMLRVVCQRVRIQGFVLADFPDAIEAARADLRRWIDASRIVHRTDHRQGFEILPVAFLDLVTGRNEGTLLVRIAGAA